jgi:DNA-binding transcriptional MerR regulator
VRSAAQFLNPAEAARRLGVSTKALRVYEQHGLVVPHRSAAGWRVYGPDEMARAAEIVALRSLGLSLAQLKRVLDGDPRDLAPALAAHETCLEQRLQQLAGTIERLRRLRADLADGAHPNTSELARLLGAKTPIAFDLPWPWGGEVFELGGARRLTYIVGPLGSGKTRLAHAIAANFPNAAFIGLDRTEEKAADRQRRLVADPALAARVARSLAWLAEDGATLSDALTALVTAIEAAEPSAFVVDMLEEGLDQPTQEALIAHLRGRDPASRPVFMLTRSNAILDLAALGPDEAVILCPANHSPPSFVVPYPGAPGFEAVATCLASPEVRARTAGLVAAMPQSLSPPAVPTPRSAAR